MEKKEKVVKQKVSLSKSISGQISDILLEMTNKPLDIEVRGSYMLVAMIDIQPEEKTASGLYLTNITSKINVDMGTKIIEPTKFYKYHPLQGIIVGIGEKEKEYKLGQHIMMTRESRTPIMINDRWYALIQNLDVALVVNR